RLDIVTGNRLDDKLIWHKSTLLSNQIIGDVNFDSTGNGCNGNNSNISNVLIETSNGVESYSTFTNLAGNYYFFVGEDEFTTQMVSGIPNYFSISPNSYVSNFVGVGNIDEANFCIEPSATVNDLNIALYPLSDARPGFDASYQLVYKNLGTTTLSGTIELIFNSDKLSILEASEPVASQTGDSVTFDYVDLAPFEYRAITISFNVAAPPTTEIGDILVFEATVNPVVGDETEEDNVFEFEQTVIGSYDPNDIQVLEGDEIFLNEADDYLHYIIRFQNTGTASAINVRVTNELDPNLDWTTMQLENISHSNRVEITDGSSVEFIFENINLPDATTNEPESHGYIQYK
ncbi:MAG TPA: T9SS C-terminal target domain-containing protein, partial [Flavobacteriaceae bacterium]|nr:T9SS C-terminal target domain-containing protein [Flavobacteriaceae bacterium]